MKKYLTIRNKEVHLGLIITLTLILTGATVYALTSYVFHQTLEVPGKAIQIFESDGTTPVPNDATISSLWQWNATTSRFELRLVIENTGTESVTIVFSHTASGGWVVSYSGATAIAKGGSVNALITAVPSSTEPGTQATFDITISAT
jgi:hypothetical protein